MSSYGYVLQQRPLKDLPVGFLKKCVSHIHRVVLGGCSPQSALRMCSCGQEVAGRARGDAGASLLRTETEGGHWKGERRNDATEHLLRARHHARHIHSSTHSPMAIYSTFTECLPGAQL